MEEFGGTLEELYIHLEQKFPYNKFYLPKSLKLLLFTNNDWIEPIKNWGPMDGPR
jgi:hypothetical protein